MDRTILHCDCNGFYASCECVLNPKLLNVPMAVGGNEESRHGIILAKNELAKKYNVKTAETIWQAKRKCPELVVVPPHHDLYEEYSKRVNDIYKEYTDLVEPFGIDESWLDVTGSQALFGDGKTIADTLRCRIKEELGITISVGVSFNKVFAKLGSDYKKPDATTVINRENFKEIIYPLPVSDLLFAGKKTAAQLEKLKIKTIGDLALADREKIQKLLGKNGEMLISYARGEDQSPVMPQTDERELKSVGNGITFSRDLLGEEQIKQGIHILTESVSTRMKRHKVKCTTVRIQIKGPDFKTVSRQRAIEVPTNLEKNLRDISYELLCEIWDINKPIRALTVTGANLVYESVGEQLNLFEAKSDEKRESLEDTIINLRKKYGFNSVKTADILNNDITVTDNHITKK